MRYTLLDYEYRNTAEPTLEVVCCAYEVRDNGEAIESGVKWLHQDPTAQEEFTQWLMRSHDSGSVFVSYNVIAEARATLSLGIPQCVEWKWIDLLLENKQARNGNFKHLYGKYLDKKGMAKTSYPPPVDERGKVIVLDKKDPRKKNNSKTNIDLPSAIYHYLGIETDVKHKHAMRDLILRGNYSPEEKERISKYAADDVKYLPALFVALQKEIRKLTGQTFEKYLEDAYVRAEWAARLALIESVGMPVNLDRLRRIAASRAEIIEEWTGVLCREQFPFYLKTKDKWVFSDVQKELFVTSKGLQNEWPKAKKSGKYSFASEVLDEYAELYPEIKELTRIRNFDSQTKSYTKTDNFENILVEQDEDEVSTEGKETIFEKIGSDGRLRCYFNPYGTQTGRNAPPARSFLLAQAKWIRSCLRPPEGWCYTAVDYSSEEFIIAACESEDDNMVAAYDTPTAGGKPDVYVNFGVLASVLPPTATKKSHPAERTQLKATVLGMQFGMGVPKLHRKVIADSGDKSITEDRARELHGYHKETFSTYWGWSRGKLEDYSCGTPLRTRDGFWLFTDNPNQMSVANFPIQGAGGAILRHAVRYAQTAGLLVVAPLHDALYILHPENDTRHIEVLKDCMNRAFRDFYGRDIRMDTKTWGNTDEFVEEGGEHTHGLLAKYFMEDGEFGLWILTQ
jgi:hypothetical protein